MRSNASTLKNIDSGTFPAAKAPDITRAQLWEVQSWLRGYKVTVGDWMRGLQVPPYGTLSSLVRDGVDLHRRFSGGDLVAPKYLANIVFEQDFSRQSAGARSIHLCTKPLDGGGKSLAQARGALAMNGRRIASSAEVVAGFVAYGVASLVPRLQLSIERQELERQGRGPSVWEPLPREFAQGFAPSCVFRSSSKTFIFNSLVGLQPHDLSPYKSDPSLYVVERR